MQMPFRNYTASSSSYRYGFNGKENDNEVKGVGNEQDYGERIYDTRVGRFLSTDPLTRSYPMLTPYQFASNDPIESVDVDGLERYDYRLTFADGKPKLDLISVGEKMESYGGIFGYFSATTNVPAHYRVEYNGEHYFFASGGQNSDYVRNMPPPLAASHVDAYDLVYPVSDLWALQKDPGSFVKSHTSIEDRIEETGKQAIRDGIIQYLSNAPANLTEAYGYYTLTQGKTTISNTNEQATAANGGNTAPATANTASSNTPVQPYEVGEFDDLQKRSVVGDKLDLHHVPQKKPAGQVISGYNGKKGTAIALPENVHETMPTQKGTYTGTPRKLLAKDAKDLRKAGVPSAAVKKVVEAAKNQHPQSYKKK